MKRTILVIMCFLATFSAYAYQLQVNIRNTATIDTQIQVSLDGNTFIQETLPPGKNMLESIWFDKGNRNFYIKIKSAGCTNNSSMAAFEDGYHYLASVDIFLSDNGCSPSYLYRNSKL